MKTLSNWIGFASVLLSLAACKTGSNTTQTGGDNSRLSVDWTGTYQGMLPCADCQGIKTTLSLNQNQSYKLRRVYVGKTDSIFRSEGRFSWDVKGGRVKLDKETPGEYLVGENRLFQLDQRGNRITGALADRYVLDKIPDGLLEKYWKLKTLNGKPVVWSGQAGREPHIILKTDDGRLVGSGGCNRLMGGYELAKNNRIRFPRVATTLMACPDMEGEQQFLKALETADSYILKGDTLILNRARMAPLATFEAVYLR